MSISPTDQPNLHMDMKILTFWGNEACCSICMCVSYIILDRLMMACWNVCSVIDAGKSTIGGQILYLSNMVDERTIQKYEREAKDKNRESWYSHRATETDLIVVFPL